MKELKQKPDIAISQKTYYKTFKKNPKRVRSV